MKHNEENLGECPSNTPYYILTGYCRVKHVAQMFLHFHRMLGLIACLCPHFMWLVSPHSDLIPHIPSIDHPKKT
jgi:hypothetical protein